MAARSDDVVPSGAVASEARVSARSRPPRWPGLAVVAVKVASLVALALGGCAPTLGDSVDHLGDGRFRLKCRGALARCLARADDLCHGTRFEVEAGWDARDYLGPQGVMEAETRTSEATVRCGPRGKSLFMLELARKGPAGSADPAGRLGSETLEAPGGQRVIPTAAEAGPGRSSCIPGATQLCVGPAACRGGQACLRDGSGFSPCDCGGTAPAGPVQVPVPGSVAPPQTEIPSLPSASSPSPPPSPSRP